MTACEWPGTIYLTKNTDAVGNDTPGDWNHAAIYVGNKIVVEAQRQPNAVIQVEQELFEARYPEFVILEHVNSDTSMYAAGFALEYIGTTFRELASVFLHRRPGENCVSICRKAYMEASGIDPRWRRPDHIYRDKNFRIMGHKKDYENWRPMDDQFKGRIL